MAVTEPEIRWARRAFPKSQELLAGEADRRLPRRHAVGWYGTEMEAEQGAFAVVRAGAGLDDLFGQVLKITGNRNVVFVYVLGSRGIPTDIAVSRRAFMALGRLSHESLLSVVEVVV